jgi:hypothetical protein
MVGILIGIAPTSAHNGGYSRGYLPTHSRSWPLARPWLWSNASRPTVFLCSGAQIMDEIFGPGLRLPRRPTNDAEPYERPRIGMVAGLVHVRKP